MTMTSGLVLIGGCFIVAELCHILIRKRMSKQKKPYELQYVPVFFIMFCMLSTLQNLMNFPPLVNVFLKFGLLYSGAGITLLFILFYFILHTLCSLSIVYIYFKLVKAR